MSPVIICAFLSVVVHNRGKKRLSDSSVLGQKEPKNILFWFLLLSNLMAKIDSKHKTQECPSKVPDERLRAQTPGGWVQEGDLNQKCVVGVGLIRTRGLSSVTSLKFSFMQRLSVNVPTVITTFQMNVYSHFIAEFGGILPRENMSVMSLPYVYNSTDLK